MPGSIVQKVRAALPWLAGALFLVGAVLVVRTLREYGGAALAGALGSTEPRHVTLAVLFAAGSYGTLTLFDWLGLRTVGAPRIGYGQVAAISFAALSVGHTVGFSALSSGTIRYRMYARLGLSEMQVVGVMMFSATTVALGLAGAAGLGSVLHPAAVGRMSRLAPGVVPWIGAGLLATIVAYLVVVACARGSLHVRGRRVLLPSLPVALLQVLVGCTNYALVGALLHAALGQDAELSFLAVASLYAAANTVALLSHVPGGLGVLEAVVLAAIPGTDAVRAVVTFRLVYNVVPFVLGLLVYSALELALRRRPPVQAAAGAGRGGAGC